MSSLVKEAVAKRYSAAAREKENALCCPTGYNFEALKQFIPQEVLDISYGCGTPAGLDSVKPGEIVLDIGSGGGIDCFEALHKVGQNGRVIGVDMTDEMLAIARKNAPIVAKNLNLSEKQIEFLKGEAEHLPLPDQSVDLIISNCVINLSPEKQKVFQEMYRVLRVGGRFTISDIVCSDVLPQYLIRDTEKWGACLTGAMELEAYTKLINHAGFVGVLHEKSYPWQTIDGYHFYSITLTAHKLPSLSPEMQTEHGYAVLTGPFSRVVDEYHNLFVRGKSRKIDAKTLQLLQSSSYQPYFMVSKNPIDTKELQTTQVFPEAIGCVYTGDFAVYGGPFCEVDDDDAHTYLRGVPQEICGRTRKVMLSSSYRNAFALFNKASTAVSPESCSPSGACC